MLKEADRERVFASTNTALNEDKNFFGIVPGFQQEIPLALDVYGDKTRFLIDMLNDIALADRTTITPDELAKVGTSAHEAAFDFWNKLVAQEDAIISDRLAALKAQRTKAYLLSALAIVLAAILFAFVTRRITGTARD